MPGLADQIPFLGSCLEGTDIELLELTCGQDTVRLRRDAFGRIAAGPAPPSAGLTDVTAPSVGVFRRAHPLQTAPLAQAGQRLAAGDPVGVLLIGSLLIHVAAPKDGTVFDVLVEDGAAVGYGTALVRMMESEP